MNFDVDGGVSSPCKCRVRCAPARDVYVYYLQTGMRLIFWETPRERHTAPINAAAPMRAPRKYQVRFVMAFAYCSDVKAPDCEIAPLGAKGGVN